MVHVQAFRGLRFDLTKVGDLSDVVAPPYDVIDQRLQAELYARHPHNIVRLILNRPEEGDGAAAPYERAADLLEQWKRTGLLAVDKTPAIYVYHQVFGHDGVPVVRRGFTARIRLEPFGQGGVHPHEETHAKVKEDRLKLTRATATNLSQIFGFFVDEENQVQSMLESAIDDPTPVVATDHLGVQHKLWRVTDEAVIAQVAQQMAERDVYVADGHHRYETACTYRDELQAQQSLDSQHPAQYVSMTLVGSGDPGLIVLPTHRLFRGAPPLSSEDLQRRLAGCFDFEVIGQGIELAERAWAAVRGLDSPSTLGLFTQVDLTWHLASLNPAGERELARLAPEHSPAWRGLGVAVLHELIVKHLLQLTNLPSPRYVHSIDEVVDALHGGDSTGRDATGQAGIQAPFYLAALVQPASLADIQAVSRSQERMPAKSTYFYPKLLSGLVLNPLH